jgi:hypothetical protein
VIGVQPLVCPRSNSSTVRIRESSGHLCSTATVERGTWTVRRERPSKFEAATTPPQSDDHAAEQRSTAISRSGTVDDAVLPPHVWGKLAWLLPAALVVIGLVVFSNSVSGPFIWDDRVAIVENASIAPPSGLSAAFHPPAENPMTGRPLVNASLALNYRLGGLHPFGYHVWNIPTHIARIERTTATYRGQ